MALAEEPLGQLQPPVKAFLTIQPLYMFVAKCPENLPLFNVFQLPDWQLPSTDIYASNHHIKWPTVLRGNNVRMATRTARVTSHIIRSPTGAQHDV